VADKNKWIEINNENPELPILNSRRIASYFYTAVSMMDMIRMTLKTPSRRIFQSVPFITALWNLRFCGRSHYRYRNGAIDAIDSQAFHKRPEW
jgi:hypothetical protein